MAQRKLQQEIDKCFKNVDLGVESFDSLYDKYEQSGNAPQREKAVEALKTQCKKLQRLRDQIKQWAASNEVKDKVNQQEFKIIRGFTDKPLRILCKTNGS